MKNFKRTLLVSSLILGGLISSQGSAFAVNADVAYDVELQDTYDLNEKITIPECFINGKKANAVVTYPDGTMVNDKNIDLTMPGKYSVTFSNSEGSETKTFFAYGKKFTNTNSSNLVEYRANQKFQIATDSYSNVPGVFAEITDGAVLKYNVPIDISDCKMEDCILSLNVIATEDLSCDMADLYVRLTDVLDETNYVDFVMSHPGSQTGDDQTNYFRAGAYNQVTSGFEEGKKNIMNVGKYGAYARCTFTNNAHNGNNLTDAFEVRMDYAKRIVYGPKKYYGVPHYICDLDSPDDFGENLWNGFSNGKCFVSVFAKNYFTSKAQVFITKIGDLEGTDFSDDKLIVNEAPVIDVDFDEYNKNSLPSAVLNKPYTILNATAHDYYSWCSEVKTNVYLNYQDEANRINVSVTDNKFTPKIPGLYTIEYSAVNGFGNKATETVTVFCATTNDPLKIELGDHETEAYVGTKVRIADYSAVNNQGKYSVNTTVTVDGEEVAIIDNCFTPMKEGTFKVSYKATDFAGQTATKSYNVNVTTSDAPVYVNEPIFPKYFISGLDNEIPMFEAVDFKDGAKQITTEVFVNEENRGRTKLTSNLYKPTLKNYDYDAKLIYVAQGKFESIEKEVDIRVRNITTDGTSAARFDTRKLFVTDDCFSTDFERIPGSYDVSNYASYTTNASGKLSFVNPIPLEAFNIKLNIVSKNFNSLSFVLSDYDTRESHKISMRDVGEKNALFSIDNGIEYLVEGFDMTQANSDIILSYSSNKITLNLLNEFSIDGSIFGSGKIYVDIMLEGVTSQSEIIVQSVCNQNLDDTYSDIANPILYTPAYQAYKTINTTLVVKPAQCLDMIKPYTASYLTVIDPNNEVVDGLSNLDITKTYSFKVTKYGKYLLRYYVGGKLGSTKTINVIDDEEPVITLINQINSAYRVGDSIKMNAKATDDVDSNLKVYVVVQNAYGRNVSYKNGDTYTFTRTGNYKIKFYAYDNTGNYGHLTVNVVVK